jgi:hypothetical protein
MIQVFRFRGTAALLGAALVAQSAPLPAQSATGPASSAATSQAAKPGGFLPAPVAGSPAGATASKPFNMTDGGNVTASYLRQNCPDLLLGLGASVKAGKVPPSKLKGLLTPQLQSRIALAAPASLLQGAAARITVIPAAPSSRQPGPWRTALGSRGLTLVEVEHSPANLVFPESWDNQTVLATLHVTSNTDGPVTVSLGPRSPFTIQSLTIYDGLIIPMRGSMKASRKVGSQVTRPPWTIVTNAGQDVDVRLAFSPHFNLFNFAAGIYKDTLTATGTYWNPGDPKEPSWTLRVPVSARFNGLALDVLVLAEDWHPELVTDPVYNPSVPQHLPLAFRLINTRDAVTGVLSGDGLPAGVSVAPATVTIGKGQSKVVPMDVSIDRSSAFYLTAPRDTAIPLNFKFQHGAKVIPVQLGLTIYEGFHLWNLSGSCGPVDFKGHLMLYATGDFHYSANGFNNNLIRPVSVAMTGGFPGAPLINCVFNISANSSGSTSYGWNTANIQSHYLTWLQQPLSMHVKVDTH